jgi:hypothetical protein
MLQKICEKRRETYHSSSRYGFMSLVDLITEIVEKNDFDALNEFHNNRTNFRYGHSEPLHFVEFLDLQRKYAEKTQWNGPQSVELADKTYDITLDKFTNLPVDASGLSSASSKGKGPDCRLYFGAYLRRVKQSFAQTPPDGPIAEEIRAGKILQSFVRYHFYKSRQEAERHCNKFWSRYEWRIKGGRIWLYLPVSLDGNKRGEWLRKNIDNPDTSRPNERKRIQAIIDRNFVKERFVPLDDAGFIPSNDTSHCWDQSEESLGRSLATVISEEKADNIHKLRPSIRMLGPEHLKALILKIFEAIDCGQSVDGHLASEFGLSPSTFSRFAGSRWDLSDSSSSVPPDLFRNVAGVLSGHPVFREVSRETGYLKMAEATLNKGVEAKGGN